LDITGNAIGAQSSKQHRPPKAAAQLFFGSNSAQH
jgi:hypothetical protein